MTVTPLHGSGDTDVTVSGALTFTTADWNEAQTVTVSAASDADAENDTATIEHTIVGADYGVNSVTADDVTVTVTDVDTASTQVTLTVNPTAVGEGASATTVTVTGTLNNAARTEGTAVTVTVSSGTASASDFAPVSAFTLTIDEGQASGTAMFTLTPTDDDVDEADETVTVEGSTAAAGLNVTATTVTITDDDERGVQVSPTTLTVPEGGDGTYTVVLTSEPTGDVTVTPLHGSGDTDVTVSPSLTFTTADWNEAQTVTVSAGSDADAENDTATIEHTIVGADYGANSVTADDVTVTVTDVDTASTQVTLTVNPTAVGEGASATTVTVTGTLNNAARTEGTAVTVTVSSGTASASDFAPVSAFTLTIDANQPSGTAMFTLTPTDDDVDEADETVTVEGSTAAAGLNVTATTVTITDDDERGVQVSPTTLTVPEGGDGTYTVVLTSEPTGDVTVTPLHGSGDTDVTVSPALTFTTADWNEAQTVTVSAGSDADAENDTATIEHTIVGADYGVNSVTADDVTVTVTDVDTASTQVTLTVNPTAVGEGASATTVTVTGTLNNAARTEGTAVTVTVSSGTASASDFTPVSAFTLTIDEGQSSGTAMFTLTPTDDDVDEADETLTVEGSTAAAGLNVTATTVTITDDDERGVQVSPTTLTVREGDDDTYTVVLTSEPTGDVTVTPSVTGSPDVTVSPSPLTFTAGNWDTTQTVTVSAGSDADAENDTATIEHTIVGADYGVNSVTAADVAVTVTDADTVSTQVMLTVNPTAVGEGDSATTVTVTGTLNNAARTEDTAVTVTVSSGTASASDFAPVSAFTLTIDANQPSGTAMFTLTPTDDDVDEVDETLTVEGGTAVGELNVTATTVTITDDDERGVQVSPTTLTVREGADGTYTVVLTSQPTGPVTVTPLHGSGDTDVTVGGALTFTAANWDDAQTVTVSAASDADAENDTATIGHTIVGADYGVNSVTADDVTVTVTDVDTASTRVTLTVAPTAVGEGDSATTVTVTGTLNNAVRDADTDVTVSVGAAGDVAMEGTDYDMVNDVTLTIGAGLASGTAMFTLTPTDDDVDEVDETLTVEGSTAVAGLDVTATTVTITDDDERGVQVSPTTLTVPEGGDGTYTVVLTSEPTGDVTVTPLHGSGDTDVTVSGALTFTTADWNEAQTVTVFVASDADAENDTATIEHTIVGADYDANSVTADDVTVTVTDDDTASTQVTLTVNPTAVGEGASATTVTVTGTLNNAARTVGTAVTVTVSSGTASASDFTPVSAFTLTIDANQSSGTAVFTLTPTDDDVDEADETVTVEGSTAAAGLNVTATTVTITDDDERGVQVSPTTLTVPEGDDGTYTVVLTSQPTGDVTVTPLTGDVTVTPLRSRSSDVTVSPSPLTFTAANWDEAQTVTVSAASDADAENGTATIEHTIAGADYGANSVTAADVTVTVTDDDTASTRVTLTVNPTAVGEGASTTTVTVTGTLDNAVRTVGTAVRVTVEAGTASTSDFTPVSAFTLTIDADQSSGTTVFTLTPTDDDVDEANETLTVEGSTAAAGLNVTATTVTITDDDERGVQVSPTTLTVPEGGDGAYTVVLTSQPTGPVTVTPSHGSGDTDVTVSGALTFTTANWNEAQTVTVSAGQDADAENDTATVTHTVSGADYSLVTAAAVDVMVDDDETVSDIPGPVTGLSATASVNKVRLAWTATQGTVLGYRIEVLHDGSTVWVTVEDNANGTSTAYAHGSGLMAGETRHYRVSAITDEGAGPPSIAVEANATDTVNGLTGTGLAIQDTPNGMATIDLCWKPSGVAVSDFSNFAIRERLVHPSLPAEWSDQYWSRRIKSSAADCEAGSIGFRVTGTIAPNIRYAYQVRARYGVRWAFSNDAEAASLNTALELRAEVLTNNSGLSVDTGVPATVCPAYDDPGTPEDEAGSFIVNVGFSTRPAVLLYYEPVTGFVLTDDVTLENATAELIDRPYGPQLGYRVRITPTIWGQSVAVSVPAGVVTYTATSISNQASNVFRRNTTASTDCDTGSDITVYRAAVRRTGILDDDDRSGVWSTGERVRATLEFSEPVTVTTDNGIPTVSLSLDGNSVQASYAERKGSDKLVFEHVVTAEQSPFNRASLVANSLSLNGGAIASPDGPAAALAHPGAVKPMKSAPEPSLTAEWVKFPPVHSGDGRKFTVRVKFSDPVTIGVKNFRADALSVTGGVVDNVWRVKKSNGEPRKDLWTIRVVPTSRQPLSLSLAARQDCNEHGAICTAHGTPLSNAASITVPGPNHDLTVADAEVEEGPGAALAFVVTLSGPDAAYRVKVDYRTEDGTATAGQDYTAVEGTLIFERGETSKTISVPVLDDAHDDDGETLTLTLSNPKRAYIVDGSATGTINNSDQMPQAWLARFGRTVADQALDAVEGRMTASRVAGTEFSLAGQRFGGAGASDALGTRESGARREALTDWLRGEEEDGSEVFRSRQVTGREFLTGSSFALTRGTAEDGYGAVWGRGAVSRFDGREGDLTLDGEVASAIFGADWTRDGVTAGLALAHSRGEGGYRSQAGDGEVESTLTGVYPWGRYEVSERLSVWGVAGYGAGTLTLTPKDATPLETDMDLAMAAVGGRSVVVEPPADGGLELAAKSDALVVRTASEEVRASGGRSLAASDARVTRVRLGVEGTWRGLGAGGGEFVPSLEVGVRHDGGDAETGFGADIGAGVAWTDPSRGLEAGLAVRSLLTHEAGGFRERGFAGSLSWDPAPSSERGPSLTLSQTVGAQASGGMDALFRPETGLVTGTANDDGDELRQRRLGAKLGYGLAVFEGRYTGTPELGLGLSGARREVILGWRLSEPRNAGLVFELAVEGVRSESAGGDGEPEHRIGVKLTARW